MLRPRSSIAKTIFEMIAIPLRMLEAIKDKSCGNVRKYCEYVICQTSIGIGNISGLAVGQANRGLNNTSPIRNIAVISPFVRCGFQVIPKSFPESAPIPMAKWRSLIKCALDRAVCLNRNRHAHPSDINRPHFCPADRPSWFRLNLWNVRRSVRTSYASVFG